MKFKYLSFALLLVLFSSFAIAQDSDANSSFPSVDVQTLEDQTFNTSDFSNDGNPIIISFWATWCKPCIQELNAIQDVYEDWQAETGVKLIAISIDDARNLHKVSPFVNGKDWPYEVYLDSNSDFKRAMNVVNVPHTFLLDGLKNIAWQHNSYAPGGEDDLYDQVLEITGGGDE